MTVVILWTTAYANDERTLVARTTMPSQRERDKARARARKAQKDRQRRSHCDRVIRRGDGTVSACMLEWDHDLLIWCQDERAVRAREIMDERTRRVEQLPAVLRLLGVWPRYWTTAEVRSYARDLAWRTGAQEH